jgi:hypothetical protein
VIVEYILLLLIAVTAAATITKRLVGRDETHPGVIVQAWASINKAVAEDIID